MKASFPTLKVGKEAFTDTPYPEAPLTTSPLMKR
ncbi:hypothetical protein HDA45_007556 [Amycolatopsis umgeniensis]|uniref:Uncharacterized protein n=1 Tax=Amycolatopsis umgeniensis TaxID=336628 RepID=A0A841B992_9PSEU|nr:hypothetical protein [Amycolatopsis umgeniensis]